MRMRPLSSKELNKILEKHKKWLSNEEDGERAILRDVDLQNVDLRQADLRSANLKSANLKSADLKYADLKYAHLQYADLKYTDLQKSDLRKADLRCAILQCADLRKAVLSAANFRKADLQNSFLQEANLRNVNLYDAKLRYVQRPWLVYAGNIGSRRSETLYFADYDNVRCGCWNNYIGGTLAEFKERIDEVYPADSKSEKYQRYRTEYLSAVKMFESMREAYLKSAEEEKGQ